MYRFGRTCVRNKGSALRGPRREAVSGGRGTASSEPPRLERKTSFPEVEGIGSAIIHSHYDYLSDGFITPPFLKEPRTVGVVGAPMSWGQPRAGTDQGAKMIRDYGLEDAVLGLEWRLDDHGDLTFDEPASNDPRPDKKVLNGRAKNSYCVGKGLKKIHDAVFEIAEKKQFALIVGGDHSISAGSVAAILKARPNTGILWIDAHGDINTPLTSPSGNMHGMPIGLLMKLVDPTLIPGFEWMKDTPKLDPQQIVYVGLRDLDTEERKVIKELNIKAYTMQHVDRYGIGGVMKRALDHLRLPDGSLRPLHLSYDIDAVDPEHGKYIV